MMTYPLTMAFEYLSQASLDDKARDMDGDGIVQAAFEVLMLRRISELGALTLADLVARKERKGRERFRDELASRKTIVIDLRRQPRSTAARRLWRVIAGAVSATRVEVFLGYGMHENEAFASVPFDYVFRKAVRELVVHAEGDDRPTVTTVRSRDLVVSRELGQTDVDPPTLLNAAMTRARVRGSRNEMNPLVFTSPRVLLYCRFRSNESIHDEGEARMGENEHGIDGSFEYLIMDAISYYGNCEEDAERTLARFALGDEHVAIDVEGVAVEWDGVEDEAPRQIVDRWTYFL